MRAELLDTDPIRRKYVYFIGNDEAVKIGFSTDVTRRLIDLRTGSNVELALIDYALADRAIEIELHHILASERIRGEWFRPTDKTMGLIDLIGDFLETFDDNDEDTDGRDTHVLTMSDLADIQARPYWWRQE